MNFIKKRLESVKTREFVLSWAFLAPGLFFLITFIFLPMLFAFYYSFCEYTGYEPPTFIGLGNFGVVFQDPIFRTALINSLIYLLVTPVLIFISIVLAVFVNQKLPAIHFFRVAYYIPVITPVVVTGIVWHMLFADDIGIIYTFLSEYFGLDVPFLTAGRVSLLIPMFVTVWRGMGYYMIIFLAALQGIPQQLLEAARIDGAGPIREMLKVKIPLLRPAIVLVSVISSINALRVFEEVFIILGESGGVGHQATTAVVRIYEVSFGGRIIPQLGEASAMAVILFVLILILSLINYYVTSRTGYEGEV